MCSEARATTSRAAKPSPTTARSWPLSTEVADAFLGATATRLFGQYQQSDDD